MGLILAIPVDPHWNTIKIWRMLFYLCLIYLQKQINVLAAQNPSTELKKPTVLYLPPGIAGQGMGLCKRVRSVKQAEEILSLDILVSWHYQQVFLLTEKKNVGKHVKDEYSSAFWKSTNELQWCKYSSVCLVGWSRCTFLSNCWNSCHLSTSLPWVLWAWHITWFSALWKGCNGTKGAFRGFRCQDDKIIRWSQRPESLLSLQRFPKH